MTEENKKGEQKKDQADQASDQNSQLNGYTPPNQDADELMNGPVDTWFGGEPARAEELNNLVMMARSKKIPEELLFKVQRQIASLNRQFGSDGYSNAYDQAERYIDWVINMPWDIRSEDNLDVDHVRDVLDSTHYGLESIKTRILEYVAILKLQKAAREDRERQGILKEELRKGGQAMPVLFFVGLPGIGKTSIAYTIAESMGREFIRVPMGGMGSALQLRGEARVTPEAEPGQVIKGLRRAQTKNPVMLLDEIDRTAEGARAQIMGVLLELLDPEQNFAFADYYMDYPFNLSEVLFLGSANNTHGISNAVLDRMELIKMPGYNDDEKIFIARDYLLPKQLRLTGMPVDAITFEEDVWPAITRPLGYDAGIRTMERTINSVVRKAALRMVQGRGDKFTITLDNVKEFLPSYL